MEDSRAMEKLLPTEPDRPMWVEIVFSAIRTLLGLVFIFWVLSLVPEESDPRLSIPVTLLIIGMGVYAVVLRWQLKRVVKSKRPGLVATESLILSAALFIAIFSAIYVIIEGDSPGSFTETIDHFTAAYFTLTVLATVGFGDITPVSDTARFIVTLQMALGLGFLAVIIKVFTGAAQRARQAHDKKRRAREEAEGS
jgi:voltage-gated potassium channel